ncbi:hypothetical protein [Gorillibacterium massiliense]|uniref:hypothetical protein n=1 Tax=Gorillibacterium massiliense TaxID=1280390 RepID=UPI0005954A6B|nr:hypothetical protein [Gorillibacterium massiliense]
MGISNQEQKRVRLKHFLKILSEDPSLSNQIGPGELPPLSELVRVSGYQPENTPVDMAELVSLLLKKRGLNAGSEDMMEYVMNGGTVGDFVNTRY